MYQSFGEVERAYLQGLVGPEDEVAEEGTEKWRKAGALPQLAAARRTGDQVWGGTQMLWIIFSIGTGSAALYLMAKRQFLWGFGIAFFLGLLLTKVTYRAFKRSKPE